MNDNMNDNMNDKFTQLAAKAGKMRRKSRRRLITVLVVVLLLVANLLAAIKTGIPIITLYSTGQLTGSGSSFDRIVSLGFTVCRYETTFADYTYINPWFCNDSMPLALSQPLYEDLLKKLTDLNDSQSNPESEYLETDYFVGLHIYMIEMVEPAEEAETASTANAAETAGTANAAETAEEAETASTAEAAETASTANATKTAEAAETASTANATKVNGKHHSSIKIYGYLNDGVFALYDGVAYEVSGSSMPVIISADLNGSTLEESTTLTITDLWQPEDGSYYVDSILEAFPSLISGNALHGKGEEDASRNLEKAASLGLGAPISDNLLMLDLDTGHLEIVKTWDSLDETGNYQFNSQVIHTVTLKKRTAEEKK